MLGNPKYDSLMVAIVVAVLLSVMAALALDLQIRSTDPREMPAIPAPEGSQKFQTVPRPEPLEPAAKP
jgi:hypothetical protein